MTALPAIADIKNTYRNKIKLKYMKVNNKIILSVVIAVAIIGVASWIFLSVNKTNQTSNLPTDENNQQVVETKLQAPDQDALAKAEEAIRNFMALPNLTFQYITTQKHPSNFTVGKSTAIADGAIRMDTPSEWDRPVHVIQQKEHINERCEVYEYEVLAKTNQVIEVHVRYPKEVEQTLATTGLKASECESYGSMEIPLKTKDVIERSAFEYLGRDPENAKILIRSDIQSEYISSKKGSANPAANEWKWEDKSVSLPDGLTGDPWQHPTIRIIMTSGGKLLYYLNTTGLFAQ